MAKLGDKSILSFGRYKGQMLKDVPDAYLKWYYKENVDLMKYCREVFGSELDE